MFGYRTGHIILLGDGLSDFGNNGRRSVTVMFLECRHQLPSFRRIDIETSLFITVSSTTRVRSKGKL
ncbi:wsv346 [White spot syndrome virus]|uniref:Wsv346 n=4 Tax=White spot syndrome virus TaxID=342409 RepID=Q8VAQ5_WSSVS|nr:wsv346 [Shrimp white spot syndrome virus]AFX59723.1 wsv346 [White spot syndrome virus]AAL33348.1 wsv346 [Shrimp white spot syndrome virus]AAL89270.1 WSSV402 [Shrimp white spot syndrome virus]AWQ60475.1 wsv346 [Shrimp white spot syndrome virus]AWQ60918.1 wsv346 [Shrimp white spot syndrome virus]